MARHREVGEVGVEFRRFVEEVCRRSSLQGLLRHNRPQSFKPPFSESKGPGLYVYLKVDALDLLRAVK
jgi:hypothetical protein